MSITPDKTQKCKHCGGDLKVMNPTGKCNHLYYPENCKICKNGKCPKTLKFVSDGIENWIICDLYIGHDGPHTEIRTKPHRRESLHYPKHFKWAVFEEGLEESE